MQYGLIVYLIKVLWIDFVTFYYISVAKLKLPVSTSADACLMTWTDLFSWSATKMYLSTCYCLSCCCYILLCALALCWYYVLFFVRLSIVLTPWKVRMHCKDKTHSRNTGCVCSCEKCYKYFINIHRQSAPEFLLTRSHRSQTPGLHVCPQSPHRLL